MGTSVSALFVTGGWVMWPLLIFSVLTWTILFERAFIYLTLRPKINRLAESLMQSLKAGNIDTAKQICHSEEPHISQVFQGVLDNGISRESAERITERNRLKLKAYYKKHLWILGTIGSSSPFIGLLGTVVGIVRAFQDMAEQGAGGFSVVAGGISEALIATASGLIVAIIALLTYNVFVNATNQTLSALSLTLDELMDQSFGIKKSA